MEQLVRLCSHLKRGAGIVATDFITAKADRHKYDGKSLEGENQVRAKRGGWH